MFWLRTDIQQTNIFMNLLVLFEGIKFVGARVYHLVIQATMSMLLGMFVFLGELHMDNIERRD